MRPSTCMLALASVASITASVLAGPGITELAVFNLGRPVQGAPAGTVVSDISNQCGVCSEGALFIVELSGPEITAGTNSTHLVMRRWNDPVNANPVLVCQVNPGGLPGCSAALVYDVVVTDDGELIVYGGHRPTVGSPVAEYFVKIDSSGGVATPVLVARQGDTYPGAPAGVTLGAFTDFTFGGGINFLFISTLTGTGVNTANDRVVLAGTTRNNHRKVMREGDQPPDTPAGSLVQSVTGLGAVSATSQGWALVPATVRIPGTDFSLVRACLYFASLHDEQIFRRMTVGDVPSEEYGYAPALPGALTSVFNARTHMSSPSDLFLYYSTEARVAPAVGQTAVRRQVSGRISLDTGNVNYVLNIAQGDALLNSPGYTYTSSLNTLYTNSSGRKSFVCDGSTDSSASSSDMCFCTSDSPFTVRLREDDPAPHMPAGTRIDGLEAAAMSTDGSVLMHASFRNAPSGSEQGVYHFSPSPSNQFTLLARLGETMTVNGQTRTVVNLNLPRAGSGSNGEDGRSRKIVPQGAAMVVTLDNGTRAVKMWRIDQPPSACPADLGVSGGLAGSDGLLDNNDFIAFINYFFGLNAPADVGIAGGLPGSDGVWDNNDFIAFITHFFDGCG